MTSPILSLPVAAGQRIGLFGGSFNPPHRGHVAVAVAALNRLGLDRIWWLVSPQNPLKDPRETSLFECRLAAVRELADHPRFLVSDLEQRLGTRTTAETLQALRPVLKKAHFVWIMGADSFAGLNQWNHWRQIPETLPLAVCDRPGWSLRALNSPAAQVLAQFRLPSSQARLLPVCRPPAWVFLTLRRRLESSTDIRKGLAAVVARASQSSS